MSKSAKDFFTKEQREDIKQAIMNAELDTSGVLAAQADKFLAMAAEKGAR